ncbi:MAG: hypothetical protein ABJL99_11165 [Aliishimia sp.]
MMTHVDTFWLSRNPILRAIRRQISVYPALYIPFRKLRMSDTVVESDTGLLIEGFPRSGNTWTEALVREASDDTLKLAHHAHAAAHVRLALSLKVPCLALFRDPDDAVTSLLTLYENQLDARGAYLEYVRFYRTIWPLRGPLLRMYSFEAVTENPDAVIEDLNNHFDLDLTTESLASTEGKSRVFARMDEKALRLKRRRTEMSKSRPETDLGNKNERRASAQRAITSPKAASARAQAYDIYKTMTSDVAGAKAAK